MNTMTVPLAGYPEAFWVELSGVSYYLVIKYDEVSGVWVMDINDNGQRVLHGIQLVQGVDLLSPFPEMQFGGQLRMLGDEPTFSNLGTTALLSWMTP